MKLRFSYLVLIVMLSATSVASAHLGRRFEVVVVGDQLAVQGYNSIPGELASPGVVRPYYNALHDHWSNLGIGRVATSDLPSFDVFSEADSFVTNNSDFTGGAAAQLVGAELRLDLQGAFKWTDPTANGPVELTPLVYDDLSGNNDPLVIIGLPNTPVNDRITSEGVGGFVLAENIGADGALDLDVEYLIEDEPAGVIYVFEWILSSDNGLRASDSIYTILSPDPSVGGLHFPSLNAEAQLGIAAIPEPGAVLLTAIASVLLCVTRRRAS